MRMMGALLRSGRLTELQALGAVGTPVYSAADQLLAAMRRQLGAEVAELFAVPKQNDRGDAIDWYAPAAGDVVPWSAASPEERTEAKAALLAARERLLERSRSLQADDDRERQVFGKLLEQATQIPGDEHVYLVNGKPVLTFWGFSRRGAPAGLDVLGELETGWPAPVRIPDATFPAEPVPPVITAEPLPVEAQRRRPWYWWLLWPLLLLLLLGLLWFGLRSCGVEVPFAFTVTTPLVPPAVETPRPPKDAALPATVATRIIEQVPQILTDRWSSVRVDRGGVVDSTTATSVQGMDTAAVEPVEGAARGEGAAPPAEAEAKLPGDQALQPPPPIPEPRPEDAAKPKEPGTEPKPEDPKAKAEADKKPEPPPADKASDKKAETPPPEKPAGKEKPPAAGDKKDGPKPPPPFPDAAGKAVAKPPPGAGPAGPPLAIPPEAMRSGSTAFLNGQWRSTTGLQDTDGNPVQLQYEFKQDQGTATLLRGAGSSEQRCTGSVKPVMRDGKLIIEEATSIRCPDGTQFRRSNVECTVGEQGQAKCRGLNEDGTSYNVSISGK